MKGKAKAKQEKNGKLRRKNREKVKRHGTATQPEQLK